MSHNNLKNIEPRAEIQWFAQQMETKLRENDWKGGWKDCRIQYLLEKLDEEVHELSGCISNEEAIKEAADVANIAMMIADLCREEKGRAI
ncbi:hypothetical protein [Paenibacillus azoreducens]|uniref:Uncharacterized protein n=1 Tax=Paenibacillus azoreducens TaxID=116718 RepID=A0A920CNY7_9BACL|nr:hypothetical protein [Paenibacillus azoreducens]GIO48011.1 hypothetical protein J34TS1_27760 [Paenibacillus azoreducens]